MRKIELKHNFRVLDSGLNSDRVIFVFTAMGTSIQHYRLFLKLLQRKGYDTIIYDYPTGLVLDARFDEWAELYQNIATDARDRMRIRKKQGSTKFFVYGVSMGTLLANRFVRETPDINHIIISLTYGDVADHIMHSPATQKTRHAMKAKGITYEYLRKMSRPFDPVQNAKGLAGKKVLLHLSKKDKVLNYDMTRMTKEALQRAGVDMQYTESKNLGHYGAGAKHMLQISRIDNFFKS